MIIAFKLKRYCLLNSVYIGEFVCCLECCCCCCCLLWSHLICLFSKQRNFWNVIKYIKKGNKNNFHLYVYNLFAIFRHLLNRIWFDLIWNDISFFSSFPMVAYSFHVIFWVFFFFDFIYLLSKYQIRISVIITR